MVESPENIAIASERGDLHQRSIGFCLLSLLRAKERPSQLQLLFR